MNLVSEVHRIKCGNGNCYIVENGTSAILVDTGKKNMLKKLFSDTFLGRIALSGSLKDKDSLSDYGINTRIDLPGNV